MSIKTILLVADHFQTAPSALEWARTVAEQHDAHLRVASIGGVAELVADECVRQTERLSVLRRPTMDPEWIVGLAQHVDLAVIGLPRPGAPGRADDLHLVERVARHVGCPMVALPALLAPGRVARHVAIAWNGAPPAQRAVRIALPLLGKAESVTIVTVHPEHPLDFAPPLLRFLERHGIAVALHSVVGKESAAGVLLAQAVEQLDSDLLVMGAWSRPPLAERLFGGATRHLVGGLGIPVLINT